MKYKKLLKITSKLKTFTEFSSKDKNKVYKNNLIIIRNMLKVNKNLIVKAISKDVNKPKKDALAEFKNSIDVWNFVINNFRYIKRIKKFTFKNGDTGIIKYEPIGLVGFITPWNYPLLTLSERLPFCIASGCPAIIKPSEFTPTFSKILQKIISSRSNLIKSINILKDLKSKTGSLLCRDPNISLISFVGSTLTGKKILNQCSSTLKKTNLELGGKNSAIISKNVDFNYAIPKVIQGIFENGGQACVAISRVIMHESIYQQFITKIVFEIEKLVNLNKLKMQAPATKIQQKKTTLFLKYIKSNYSKNIIKIFNIGSKKYTPIFLKCNEKKNFFLRNEFFFPIITFEKFRNLKECKNIANESGYGLASYVFSTNKFEKKYLANGLQSGRIWFNTSLQWSPKLPVGGYNLSGKGRDMGIEGFQSYLTTKSLYVRKKW